MSSTLKINKTCIFCEQSFIAQKVTTKYCSHKCNARHYKQKKRREKVLKTENEICNRVKIETLIDFNRKRIFSIKEVCSFVGISRTTLYRWIKANHIKASKVGGRVYISKKELKRVFKL